MAEARAYAFVGQGGEPAESRCARRSFVPVLVQMLCHGAELDPEVARRTFRINLAPLFFPQSEQRHLVISHGEPGIRATDEVGEGYLIRWSAEDLARTSSVGLTIIRRAALTNEEISLMRQTIWQFAALWSPRGVACGTCCSRSCRSRMTLKSTISLAVRTRTKRSGNKSDTLLRSVDLDDSAIVVEAYRSSIAHLTAIDRRLMELALRRDKIFRQIEDRRAGIAVPPGHRHVDQEASIEHSGDA
jgi:hypothetical protein